MDCALHCITLAFFVAVVVAFLVSTFPVDISSSHEIWFNIHSNQKGKYKWIWCIRTTHNSFCVEPFNMLIRSMCCLTFVLATGAIATFVKCICVCIKTRAQFYSNLNASFCWILLLLVPHRRAVVALINYCNSFYTWRIMGTFYTVYVFITVI